MKSILFIVNKKAGTSEKNQFPRQVKKILDNSLFSYDIVYTQYRGHATELAKKAVENNTDIVAAVGGDGSANEVAHGIAGSEASLAIIPKGSGNGLARTLRIPINTEKALSLINRNQAVYIDAGLADGHIFLSNAGVGFDALIANLFADRTGRGLINYAILVTKAMRHYEANTYQLIMDDAETEEKAFLVTVANGNQFGYNFKIAPDAKINDGLLDVCIMKPLKWWQLPVVSVRALTGRLSDSSGFIKHIRCRNVIIRGKGSMEKMQIDGEPVPLMSGSVKITVKPLALKILVP